MTRQMLKQVKLIPFWYFLSFSLSLLHAHAHTHTNIPAHWWCNEFKGKIYMHRHMHTEAESSKFKSRWVVFKIRQEKQKQHVLKRPIFTVLTWLLHLPNIFNHHEHNYELLQLYNRMTAQVLAFLWPYNLRCTQRSFKLESNWRV